MLTLQLAYIVAHFIKKMFKNSHIVWNDSNFFPYYLTFLGNSSYNLGIKVSLKF